MLRRNKNEKCSPSYARNVMLMSLNIYKTYSDHTVVVLSSISVSATEHTHAD